MSEQTLKELWMSLADKQTPLCHPSRYGKFKFYYIARYAEGSDDGLFGVDEHGFTNWFPITELGWKIYKEPKKKIKVYCPAVVMNEHGQVNMTTGKILFPDKDKKNWFKYPWEFKVIRWHEEEVAESFEDQEEAV